MKLVIFEDASCEQFYPLTYLRPTLNLRCGSTLLREKVERAFGRKADVVFVREWLREAYAVRTSARVNDLGALAGDDLVLVNGRGLWIGDDFPTAGRDACAMAGAEIVYVTLTKQTAAEDPGVRLRRLPGRRGQGCPRREDRPETPGLSLAPDRGKRRRDPRRFQEDRPERRPRHARPQRRHLGAAEPGLRRPDRDHRALRRH